MTSATFALPELNHSRQMQTIEIDLTAVDYSGNVYVAWDTPAGSFMANASVESLLDPFFESLYRSPSWGTGFFVKYVQFQRNTIHVFDEISKNTCISPKYIV